MIELFVYVYDFDCLQNHLYIRDKCPTSDIGRDP